MVRNFANFCAWSGANCAKLVDIERCCKMRLSLQKAGFDTAEKGFQKIHACPAPTDQSCHGVLRGQVLKLHAVFPIHDLLKEFAQER